MPECSDINCYITNYIRLPAAVLDLTSHGSSRNKINVFPVVLSGPISFSRRQSCAIE